MDDKCQRDGVFIAKVYHVSEKGKRKGTPRIKKKKNEKKEAKIEQTNKNIQIILKNKTKRKDFKEWNYMDDCVCPTRNDFIYFLVC